MASNQDALRGSFRVIQASKPKDNYVTVGLSRIPAYDKRLFLKILAIYDDLPPMTSSEAQAQSSPIAEKRVGIACDVPQSIVASTSGLNTGHSSKLCDEFVEVLTLENGRGQKGV
jgi:hypothetical protein